jgi:hypothetical protein
MNIDLNGQEAGGVGSESTHAPSSEAHEEASETEMAADEAETDSGRRNPKVTCLRSRPSMNGEDMERRAMVMMMMMASLST